MRPISGFSDCAARLRIQQCARSAARRFTRIWTTWITEFLVEGFRPRLKRLASGTRKLLIKRLPLPQAECLRPSFGIDPGLAKARAGRGASGASHPAKRSSQLLPAPLEDRLHEAEEGLEVVDLHRRSLAHVEEHERRINSRRRRERRGRDRENEPGLGEYLYGDCGQARAPRCLPPLRNFFLHDQRKPSRPRRSRELRVDKDVRAERVLQVDGMAA